MRQCVIRVSIHSVLRMRRQLRRQCVLALTWVQDLRSLMNIFCAPKMGKEVGGKTEKKNILSQENSQKFTQTEKLIAHAISANLLPTAGCLSYL